MRLVIDESGVHIDWADPELSLTTAQRRAMRTDEEVVVIAGAGAGKTHTLSLRYVHLLLQLSLHSLRQRRRRKSRYQHHHMQKLSNRLITD